MGKVSSSGELLIYPVTEADHQPQIRTVWKMKHIEKWRD